MARDPWFAVTQERFASQLLVPPLDGFGAKTVQPVGVFEHACTGRPVWARLEGRCPARFHELELQVALSYVDAVVGYAGHAREAKKLKNLCLACRWLASEA